MKITQEEIETLGLKKSKKTIISICVNGDINDGDYIDATNEVSSLELHRTLTEIVNKIENFGEYNWSKRSSYLSKEEIHIFEEYMPYLDNEDVHTIESIDFTFVIDGVLYE